MEEITDTSQLSEKSLLMLASLGKLPPIDIGSIYMYREDATTPEFLPDYIHPGDIAVVVHGTNVYTNNRKTVAFKLYFGGDGSDLNDDDPEKEVRAAKEATQLGGCRMHMFLKYFKKIDTKNIRFKLHRQVDLIKKDLGIKDETVKEETKT